jgi:hypothetical protein
LLEWDNPSIRILEGRFIRAEEYVKFLLTIKMVSGIMMVSNIFKAFLVFRHVRIIFGAQIKAIRTSFPIHGMTNTGVPILVSL